MKFKLLILTVSLVIAGFSVPQAVGVYLDHVDGLWGDPTQYKFEDGATLVFHLRSECTSEPTQMMNNGFTITSENCTWGSVSGAYNTTEYPLIPEWFDFVLTCTVWGNGSVEDTIGFGMCSLFEPDLIADFTGILYTITVGPITGELGSTIVLDSSWFPPSNPWMWSTLDVNVPWGGPYVLMLDDPTDVSYLDGVGLPTAFALKQNYPNPFNPNTDVQFDVPRNCHVNIAVYNVLGHKVRNLIDKELAAGTYVATWDGKNEAGKSVSSGIYFYRMNAEEFVATKKMMLLK